MKEVINALLEHPIRTAIVVGVIAGGIARVALAVKGQQPDEQN